MSLLPGPLAESRDGLGGEAKNLGVGALSWVLDAQSSGAWFTSLALFEQ